MDIFVAILLASAASTAAAIIASNRAHKEGLEEGMSAVMNLMKILLRDFDFTIDRALNEDGEGE